MGDELFNDEVAYLLARAMDIVRDDGTSTISAQLKGDINAAALPSLVSVDEPDQTARRAFLTAVKSIFTKIGRREDGLGVYHILMAEDYVLSRSIARFTDICRAKGLLQPGSYQLGQITLSVVRNLDGFVHLILQDGRNSEIQWQIPTGDVVSNDVRVKTPTISLRKCLVILEIAWVFIPQPGS